MPSTFADLGVSPDLCAVLARRGILEPFPIQTATIPDAMAGRDISGRAPTGSGKTLAFGLVIASRIGKAEPRRPRALVLVPTRELAAQVAGEIQSVLGPKRRVVAIYGGASYGPQRKALSKGATVVVACPGRLEDLVAQGDVQLDGVQLVVLDEADRMADMGFLPAVRRLLDRTRRDRQTLLFSATLDRDVDALVREYQRDPARHEVKPAAEAAGDVTHMFWRAEMSQRVGLAAALVQHHGRAMVFCRTRHGADRLKQQLKAAGVKAAAIHGNRSQAQRERALAAFADGKVSALVATDVAARGIHVDHVGCVVHYDVPADHKDYVHRSGRTGRAGATGTVVSLVTDDKRKAVRAMQRTLGLPEGVDAPDRAFTNGTPVRPAPDVVVVRDGTARPKPKSGSKPKAKMKANSSAHGHSHGHGQSANGSHPRRRNQSSQPGRTARRRSTRKTARS